MTLTRVFAAAVASLTLFSVVFAADDASDVVKLTKDNFDDIVAKEKLVFVKFFAPWCGHCQAMAEDFKTVATELKGKAVLGDVDATVEEDLAKKYNIDGFPTLKVFADGEELTDYNGGRDKESMIKFLERATLPPYEDIAEKAAFDKFIADNKGKNVLVGVALDEKTTPSFKKATFSLRDVMPDAIEFAHATSPNAVSIKGAAAGEVYLLRLDSNGVRVPTKYNAETEESIEKFVKTSALPAFQEFTQENAELYTELSIPLIVGFYKDCEGEQCKSLEKVAKSNADNGKVVFAWVNSETLSSFQEYVGLQGAKVPICAYAFEADARYALPEDFEFSEEALGVWVDDLKAGNVKPARKSQPIPETQEGPVYTIVGDSWASEVENADKDVFIAQVAEWCGHCSKLKPVMKKVAEELSKAGIDHVRIAQMDASDNDASDGYKARGFPTIHFFPKGSGKGIDFEGDRSSKGIIDFIKEKTTKEFEFDTDALGEDPAPEEEEGGDEDEGEDDEEDEGDEGEDDEGDDDEDDEAEDEDIDDEDFDDEDGDLEDEGETDPDMEDVELDADKEEL